jgi:hypothetical protein
MSRLPISKKSKSILFWKDEFVPTIQNSFQPFLSGEVQKGWQVPSQKSED